MYLLTHLEVVLFHLTRSTQSDFKKTKKKQHLESNTDWYKIVSVTQSSGYWSIYIDWQRSYYE